MLRLPEGRQGVLFKNESTNFFSLDDLRFPARRPRAHNPPRRLRQRKGQIRNQDTEGPSAPAAPAPGKAQIIFIQTNEGRDKWFTIAPTRFGVDGVWVGANQGNSYFALAVEPGVHHLCSVWEKKVGVASFTAEPGKTYYYEANTTYKGTQLGDPKHPNLQIDKSFGFSELSEDEGKYRVKASALSVSTATK